MKSIMDTLSFVRKGLLITLALSIAGIILYSLYSKQELQKERDALYKDFATVLSVELTDAALKELKYSLDPSVLASANLALSVDVIYHRLMPMQKQEYLNLEPARIHEVTRYAMETVNDYYNAIGLPEGAAQENIENTFSTISSGHVQTLSLRDSLLKNQTPFKDDAVIYMLIMFVVIFNMKGLPEKELFLNESSDNPATENNNTKSV